MPSFVKFIKDILTNKRKLEDFGTITLIKECSTIIQTKLPSKLKDPSSFSIPCLIGNFNFLSPLCDLGVGVSIMLLSVARRIRLPEIQPTTITLQLADRVIRHPCGVIKDGLLKVGKLYILVDFIVLEMEEDPEILIILGLLFLATAGALINVREGKITLKV
ncbi:PREDICTED: uncharacterized protein LOC108661137 [Theobroma cacao]|uniref:Uncharacterized protein LOC108661137 n=1 Tax=Theobroma cacao TaxID=3641 RepID=A0AB32W112_THECC|nr:PREDICTED: uncharacterized protein LOC108661137 [Theobroma cacao]